MITAKFTSASSFILRRADGCVWFVKLPWPMDLNVPLEALRQAVLQYVRSNARMMEWIRSSRVHGYVDELQKLGTIQNIVEYRCGWLIDDELWKSERKQK